MRAILKLLSSWVLVDNREAAMQVLQTQRGQRVGQCNVVTLQGDMFKCDGEVVGVDRGKLAAPWCISEVGNMCRDQGTAFYDSNEV